jgi:delta-aminolevulinic acid dehydratase/porphobilinogen synthase
MIPPMSWTWKGRLPSTRSSASRTAAKAGYCELYPAARESLYAIFRAGAPQLISYWAPYYDEIFGINQ